MACRVRSNRIYAFLLKRPYHLCSDRAYHACVCGNLLGFCHKDVKSFKAGGKEAIGVGEDENGERVSLAVLPGMDKVIVNFVGKVDREQFFEAYELANVLL